MMATTIINSMSVKPAVFFEVFMVSSWILFLVAALPPAACASEEGKRNLIRTEQPRLSPPPTRPRPEPGLVSSSRPRPLG
jgi:hypothetical protein